ncbi:MAG: S8 family peptidase [Acidobacteriota bacterium]
MIVRHAEATQSYPAGTRVADVIGKGNVVTTSAASENETVRYIIEVASPAGTSGGAVLNKSALGTTAAAMRSGVKARLASVSPDIRMLREYTQVVNGMLVAAPRKNLSAIRALPGVTGVHEDVKVSTSPVSASSSTVSTVSPLQDTASGKGVRIGIIDTGIDYLHEALGGGFGAAYKVCGGYDLVGDDTDPMDDNGHGTHVAGIIAGDSKLVSGMASGARIYAYKALDAAGEGYASTVIAAIERAIEDSVKVINLSLGTSAGDPDDILSRAVDKAAAAGIVVVAAAGNAGDYGTIGSPGAARGALTVGAIDAANNVASFSSKGPVQKSFGLKPDVVAPGVSILSCKNGGGYVAMSGTSMAAPYVSALAAALIGMHPSWTAEQVRGVIIESAQRLSSPLFAAGAGKADPMKAVRQQTIAAPGSMSLGFNTNTAREWTKRETLSVANTHQTPQTYILSAFASSPGIGIQLFPSSVTIAPAHQAMIIADVRADNTLLSDNTSANEGYTGAVTAASETDTVTIPFTFFKGTMLRLQFDEAPWQVIVHNRKDKSYAFQPKSSAIAVVLPSGLYDVVTAFFPSTYIVREGVAAAGLTDVTVNRTEAAHPVLIDPTDEAGSPVEAGLPHEVFSAIEGVVHRASGIGMIAMSGGPYTGERAGAPAFVSGMSSAYVFGTTLNIQKENTTTYTYEAAVDSGIAGPVTVRFEPAEIRRLEVKYDIDSSAARTVFPIVWSYIRQQGSMTGTTYYDGTAAPLRYPFTQTSFYYKRTSPSFPVFHYREAYKY